MDYRSLSSISIDFKIGKVLFLKEGFSYSYEIKTFIKNKSIPSYMLFIISDEEYCFIQKKITKFQNFH